MKQKRSNIPSHDHQLVSLDERDLRDLDRLLGKLRGRRLSTVETLRPKVEAAQTVPDRTGLMHRAQLMLDYRRKRTAIFGRAMFKEPAWEMLLILYLGEEGQRQTQATLSEQTGASRSTTSRWIDFLAAEGLISHQQHPTDKRMTFIGLTEKGRALLDLYLSETS